MDSGAFTELSTHGQYRHTVYAYAREINRWRNCGNMLGAVSQDYMCESWITSKTGMTVKEHQDLTIARYVALKPLVKCYVMPVLQGFTPQDYVTHLNSYGDLLPLNAWVGVGSICKRNTDHRVIEYILSSIKTERPDLKLHGFGLKLTALRQHRISNLLYTADSMAWSFSARKQGLNAHDWKNAERFKNSVVIPEQERDLCLT